MMESKISEADARDLLRERGVIVDICDSRSYEEIASSLGLVSIGNTISTDVDQNDGNIDIVEANDAD
ncbi:hypothetical protein DYH10_02610 [Candidatus Saccharibacteria bacterium CPR2]|nr:hypothetical protein [Candidatus Saccharibacteria bacterium CPR2]